jgi:hypothetical protein
MTHPRRAKTNFYDGNFPHEVVAANLDGMKSRCQCETTIKASVLSQKVGELLACCFVGKSPLPLQRVKIISRKLPLYLKGDTGGFGSISYVPAIGFLNEPVRHYPVGHQTLNLKI